MTRALVLGGGGPVGIGWELGIARGLAERGVDIAAADAIVGTSAGAFVGAELALGVDLSQIAPRLIARGATLAAAEGASMGERMERLMAALASAAASGLSPEETRRTLGRLSLDSPVSGEEQFLGLFAELDGCAWPARFSCTAVDTATGAFVVWSAGADADLRHAVAASCAAPCVYPAVSIGARRYMDGGLRSVLNADLATGYERVLVVSATVLSLPTGMSHPALDGFLSRMAGELAGLRASGSTVEVIEPNPEFLDLSGWGSALMDYGLAADAHDAGIRHGLAESQRAAELWNA